MGGDAVEIWDVRRGWAAKWAIGGLAAEGVAGTKNNLPPTTFILNLIVDIAFNDSHAIWAQHWSGTFAQLDLRDSIKPLDSIPRVAATWEVSGSLAFVSDQRKRWEPPYDDMYVLWHCVVTMLLIVPL
jgi:WD repeat-containing protein 24